MTSYTIKKSVRAKRLRITIHKDGTVVVTIPKRASLLLGERFVREKIVWIERKIEEMHARVALQPPLRFPRGSKKDLAENKEKALAFILERLEHFNSHYKLKWKSVYIKHLKTRWGSCSKIGNLNFSYKIIYLPPQLADYLVVHELCHLGEFNHSQDFWNLLGETIPGYTVLRKQLRDLE